MLRILTVLCLVVAAMGHMGGEAMMKKYAYMKIMSSCVGEETVMNWKMEMKVACDKCKGQDITQTMIDIQAMLKEMKKKYSPFTRQSNTQQPIFVPVYVGHVNQPQQQFSGFPQLQQLSSFRTKRSMGEVDLSPAGIEKMKAKMMAKISNITCVLKEMNCMTADNQPNYEYFNEKVNDLPVDEVLKEDFREALDMCRDFAMCMPVDKFKNPVKKELGTTMAFMKCMHMKKAMVCMKNDMRKYAPMMGFEGNLETEEGQDMIDQITDMLTVGPEMM